MFRHQLKQLSPAILGLTLALLLSFSIALAQTGAGFDLSWGTVDGGGGEASGGGITLLGAAGQPEAGPALVGGGVTLVGGFLPGAGDAIPIGANIYLPLISR